MPRLSVIIPTYNRASTITKAVESVLNQTHAPGEVIVVDDGSTDDTSLKLRPYFKYIRYLKTGNRGVSAARNQGVNSSTGQWLAFLDSDDEWKPEKLQTQFEALNETGLQLCFCSCVDRDGRSLDDLGLQTRMNQEKLYHTRPAGDPRYFRLRRHPFLQSMLVHRSIFAKTGGFSQELCVAEDTRLIYQLTRMYNSVVIPQRLCVISRNTDRGGLSQEPRLPEAAKHYACYASVQGEILPHILALNARAGVAIRNNFYYFISRQAEIALATGAQETARCLASAAIVGSMNPRIWLRCSAMLLLPQLFQRIYQKKWTHTLANPDAS